MRCVFLTIVLALVTACTTTGQVSGPSPTPTAASSSGDAAASPRGITVDVRFPQSRTLVVRDVRGQVTNGAGEVVADFLFESGWLLPDDWQWGDLVEESGAATEVMVELPGPGRYTFRIDPYVLSHMPCGTCEASFAETSITQDVIDESTVRLPPGDKTSES